ncbi:MAG TPA: homocysteine S-methyltransferase family protein, partial [Ignavibacteriaceae bacterium]|nr:homocysteine S-methyltransferase family protein [Ignavibacteriaceae bacterium]
TLMGISPKQMTEKLIICGADIIGANCGRGFSDMIEIIKEIRDVSKMIPIIVQPNAGLPEIVGDKLVYKETPDYVRNIVPEIINAGVNIIGGCCGTTPEHIKVISEIVKNYREKN